MLDKFVIILGVFHYDRLKRFIDSFESNPPGTDYDLLLVHNSIEDPNVVNTYTRPVSEIEAVNKLVKEFSSKYSNITVLERPNIGRDMGALQAGYVSVRDQYKYYFFLNERVVIKTPNWLKMVRDHFESTPTTGCIGIQVCHGHKYPWCLRCFFWAQTNESIRTMNWWPPQSRPDAHIQEMELVYPHIKSLGLNIYQIGNGTNLMNHYLDNGQEDQRFIINRHEFTV